ncbi:MAG: hypothetical protein H0T47_14975 [Planctomycetaceae bacterium]|nr:hypothetical protein [Planctomycetaceae bacterium]
MLATRNDRLLTMGLTAVTAAIATILVCERFERHPVVPLHNGQVSLLNGSVVIEEASESSLFRNAARGTASRLSQ